jgi:hypothetical protein
MFTRTGLCKALEAASLPSDIDSSLLMIRVTGVVISINQSAASGAGERGSHDAEDDSMPLLSGIASSQVWHLSSSVEVHRASGPDSDEEEEEERDGDYTPAPVEERPEARAKSDCLFQDVQSAGTENPVFLGAETEVDVGESAPFSDVGQTERDADQDICFDRSGGAVV